MKLIKILSALTINTISWLYPLMIIILAGVLESWLLFSLFPAIKPLVLVAIFPLIYLLWLFLFLCLSIVGTKLLFLFVKKPKILEFNVLEDLLALIQIEPVFISYRLQRLMSTLPFLDYFLVTPIALECLRNLVMRAYSPEVYIGKLCAIIVWPQDPDLTYIGNNVVIGINCDLVAHGLNSSDGQVKYFSEPIIIEDKSTIGGNSRIGMGVKIEEGGIVEVGSNVLPYTRIGRGEIWGGQSSSFSPQTKRICGYQGNKVFSTTNRSIGIG